LLLQKSPIKTRPWVLLATGRDVFVSGDVHHGVALAQGLAQAHQGRVLQGFEVQAFQAFEFDAHRGVVATFSAPPTRASGVPSPGIGIDKLHDLTIASNKEVAGDFRASDLVKVGVGIPIEAVAEKRFDVGCAIDPRGQADGVNHHQVNRGIRWSGPEVGRVATTGGAPPTALPIV
jgi:hypothetical protein